jgi:hypothetical protein
MTKTGQILPSRHPGCKTAGKKGPLESGLSTNEERAFEQLEGTQN